MKNKLLNWPLWKNSASRSFIVASAALLVAAVVITLANVRPQEGRVIISYTPYDRRLGSWWELYQIPLTGLILLGVNSFLAAKLLDKDRLLSHIILAATLFIELIILITALNFLINIPQ